MGKVVGNANSIDFPKGGKTKMFGQQHASPMVAGQTSREDGGSSEKFASGGKTKMFGKGHAKLAEPGVTAKNSQ